jgi:branched-chain amino acid transport system ATP-binding protein
MTHAGVAPLASPTGETVLETQGLAASYGQVQALHPTDLQLGAGELVAVLGANGAGKSTLLRAIMGLVANTGSVRFRGMPMPRSAPAKVAARGVVLVPEGRGIFGPMTVADNLRLGAYRLRDRAELARRQERVLTLFPRLKERLAQAAGSMSGGEQQMLAIGRALMATPQVLLLDEPSLGLAPRVTEQILETLGLLNREGLSIVLVEQKAPLALELAKRAYLLSVGRVVRTLEPGELTSYDELAQHYLA